MNDHRSLPRLTRDTGVQLAIFVSLIAVSLLVGVLFNLLPLWQAVLSLVLASLACASISIFHMRIASLVNKHGVDSVLERFGESLDDTVDALAGLIQEPRLEWLWTNAQLASYEVRCQAREIWLLSPDLDNDIGSGPFARIVRKNASRGIRYSYFVPDSRIIRGRLQSLREIFSAVPSQLQVELIPAAAFDLLPVTHVVAFFLTNETVVFCEAPAEGRGFWIRCGKRSGDALVGQLTSFRRGDATEDAMVESG